MIRPISSLFTTHIVPNFLPALGTAFMAMSRPIVAGSFRVKDEYDFQKLGLKSAPQTVIKREIISTSLTGFFSFMSGLLIFPIAQKLRWQKGIVSFFVAISGAFLGEYISRLFAYKDLEKEARGNQIQDDEISSPHRNVSVRA
ncbi:MAG: hypothetical protein SFT81_07160 [Candidatus Caenarcaniphilales bacterium]|nr:hypothetical protein [Candidatus Caenarcaniphilales bacterium]